MTGPGPAPPVLAEISITVPFKQWLRNDLCTRGRQFSQIKILLPMHWKFIKLTYKLFGLSLEFYFVGPEMYKIMN